MIRLFKRLVSMPSPRFAFWSQAELVDLAPLLSEVFEVENFLRDYEDTWEWLEAASKQGFRVNISRTHDQRKGDYHLPVVISLNWGGRPLGYNESVLWITKVADRLNVEISAGTMVDGKSPDGYDFRVDEIIVKKKESEPSAAKPTPGNPVPFRGSP